MSSLLYRIQFNTEQCYRSRKTCEVKKKCLPICEYCTMFWWAAAGAANREKNRFDSSNSRSMAGSSFKFSLLLSSTRTDPLAERPKGRKPKVAASFTVSSAAPLHCPLLRRYSSACPFFLSHCVMRWCCHTCHTYFVIVMRVDFLNALGACFLRVFLCFALFLTLFFSSWSRISDWIFRIFLLLLLSSRDVVDGEQGAWTRGMSFFKSNVTDLSQAVHCQCDQKLRVVLLAPREASNSRTQYTA